MKRLAVFVEGKTESIFVKKLISEIGNRKEIYFRREEMYGGGSAGPRIINLLFETPKTKNTKYEVLIRISCNDDRVFSDIKDNYVSLLRQYSKIIGLRDLYPDSSYSDLEFVKAFTGNEIKSNGLNLASIVIAVMEVETWFVAELTHYQRIDPKLTLDAIKAVIDLEAIKDFEKEIAHPADTLHEIYKIAGYAYKKTKNQVTRTVNNLDYEEIYINLRKKIAGLNELISHIDDFFS